MWSSWSPGLLVPVGCTPSSRQACRSNTRSQPRRCRPAAISSGQEIRPPRSTGCSSPSSGSARPADRDGGHGLSSSAPSPPRTVADPARDAVAGCPGSVRALGWGVPEILRATGGPSRNRIVFTCQQGTDGDRRRTWLRRNSQTTATATLRAQRSSSPGSRGRRWTSSPGTTRKRLSTGHGSTSPSGERGLRARYVQRIVGGAPAVIEQIAGRSELAE
jgi:hypothetical protein